MAGYLPEYFYSFVEELDEHPWLFASLASVLVGLSGVLPMLIIPLDSKASFEDGPGAATLRILLSFAVGGLLGDVFLHLLPEAWENDMANAKDGQHVSLKSGLWCLFGMLVFIVVEKLFATTENAEEEKEEEYDIIKQNGSVKQIEIEEIEKLLEIERKQRGMSEDVGICGGNGTVTASQLYDTCIFNNNTKGEGVCCSAPVSNGSVRCKGNRWMGRCLLREAREKTLKATKEKTVKKNVAGYLNLMANSIDNFTHGLAVGGSFLVGFRVGVLTTFAILVHEIPHEIGDFAILLRSGFSRWDAAKAQLATATAGLFGAMTALAFSGASNSIEAKTSWIVPFTAGGFLHIALVTVLPDLLREPDKLQSMKHFAALTLGILLMYTLTQYFG